MKTSVLPHAILRNNSQKKTISWTDWSSLHSQKPLWYGSVASAPSPYYPSIANLLYQDRKSSGVDVTAVVERGSDEPDVATA